MKKILSFIIILLLLIPTIAYATSASDILMSLDQATSSEQPAEQEEISQEASDFLTNFESTINHDDYVTPEDDESEEIVEDEENNVEAEEETSTTQKVTKTGSLDEEFTLTTSDIINIIVISVGVVLIFLAIAILIKK